jgi:ketosteroid isomerase-like protein
MSEGNVEIVRRAWEAWERRDIQAMFGLVDPAIVWEMHGGAIELRGLYHGHEGVGQLFQQWLESFEADSYEAHAETFIDAVDNVVVGWRARARGKASGAEVEMSRWHVYRMRNGLALRVDVFETESEALEAAGLQG